MTRRASRLFQEHTKLVVLGEAGFAALKLCYQVYYCPDADSMAASHGDDIIAEGEPEELDRLDEVSKRLVVVEVHGQCLKRHVVHIEDQGLETSCCDHQKPFQGWCEKDLGRRDPEALEDLAEKLSLRIDHLEHGDIVRIPVEDSNWSGTEERYSTHAGREFQEDILWIPALRQTRYEP